MEIEKIDALVKQKKALENQLAALLYGAIEVRGNKLYTHFRENGIPITKYIGDNTKEMTEKLTKNNEIAKNIKKELHQINKELKKLNFTFINLDEKIMTNIDFARRNLADTIYKQAVLEGVATTYSDTETIIEGGKVNNMTPTDIQKIVNLKHAWDFILNETVITIPGNFSLLCDINHLIEEGFYYHAGKVRSTPVKIGGTNYTPPLPIESVVKEELDDLLKMKIDQADKAIQILLYIMKRQIFIDGNKRTAVIFANHLLISHGAGLIAIPENDIAEFKKLLISYYESNDTEIVRFLKNKCYQKIK